jgi:hypothetical protein
LGKEKIQFLFDALVVEENYEIIKDFVNLKFFYSGAFEKEKIQFLFDALVVEENYKIIEDFVKLDFFYPAILE